MTRESAPPHARLKLRLDALPVDIVSELDSHEDDTSRGEPHTYVRAHLQQAKEREDRDAVVVAVVKTADATSDGAARAPC